MNNTISIGFTGTRNNISIDCRFRIREIIENILAYKENENKEVIFIHGGCIGADQVFHDIALSYKVIYNERCSIEVYSGHSKNNPNDLTFRGDLTGSDYIHRSLPFLERNKIIVNKSDLIIAVPPKYLTGGTRYTMNYAKKQNKQITEIDIL